MEYRYHLLKYKGISSRFTCPSCGRHHCFTPYVDADEQIVGEEYGRCDHESSCGYVKYPPSEYDSFKRRNSHVEDWRQAPEWLKRSQSKPKPRVIVKPQPKPEQDDDICTIPKDIMLKTVRTRPLSDFLKFLLTIVDVDSIIRIVKEYLLGVTKSGEVIFYQIDLKGRCRTGKVMKYDSLTGHRIKDTNVRTPITWVHSLLKQRGVLPQEWELTQCLFGEHLLKKYPEKPVCLVESEKTAIICACINPECVWLATGGKGQLNDRVEVLEGRTIIAFPDVDGYDTWVTKAAERPYLNIIVSDLLEKNATQEDRNAHIDIADILIRRQLGMPSYSVQKPQSPPPDELYADNPVMREVIKYISQECWGNVDALIRELDLEFIGVTRMVQKGNDTIYQQLYSKSK